MIYSNNELLARFVLKGLDGSDTSNMTEDEIDDLTDQVVEEFGKFTTECDYTSKESQMKSITNYFANK